MHTAEHDPSFYTEEAKYERIDKFVEWKLLQGVGRLGPEDPQTEGEFAESIGLKPDTLSKYKKDRYYKEQWRKGAMDPARAVELREVAMEELWKTITEDDLKGTAKVQALKAYLENLNKIAPVKGTKLPESDYELESLDSRIKAKYEETAKLALAAEEGPTVEETSTAAAGEREGASVGDASPPAPVAEVREHLDASEE